MRREPKKYFGFTFDEFTELIYTVKLLSFWPARRAFSLFETMTGSFTNGCVDNWAIFTLYKSSENSSDVKPKYFWFQSVKHMPIL